MASSYLVRRGATSVRRLHAALNKREFSALVAIEDEFPGLPTLSPTPAKTPSASVTTLSNGLTIVTEDSSTLSTVTLTYPKAGSSNESVDEQGAAFVNKFLNFKSGSGLSSLLINRTIEDEGGTPFTTVDREGATLGFTVTPERAVGLIPLLATTCSFEKWDLRDAMKTAVAEIETASKSTPTLLSESVFSAAYGAQSPAGRTLYFSSISKDSVATFRERAYGLNGAILAATGIMDHSAFVTEVGALLSTAAAGSAAEPSPITYLGGEARVHNPFAPYSRLAFAFPAPASPVVASVVKHFFNISGSEFKASASVSTGLLIVQVGGASAGGLADALFATLKKAATPETLKRAKNLAKAEALLSLDSGSQSLAAAATSAVLSSGTFIPGDISKSYAAVTDAQVKDAISAILKTNPSAAAVGSIASVPYHATIASSLK